MPLSVSSLLSSLVSYVEYDKPSFVEAVLFIVLCPLIWNVVARIVRVATSSDATPTWVRYACCYALTVWIFSFSSFRDHKVNLAMLDQPQYPPFVELGDSLVYVAYALFAVGQLFVLSSFYQLGITGTFLGDYCGILMDAPVTAFPFNVMENPMYNGSTLCFCALALYNKSIAGIVLTAVVFVVYQVALMFEGPYTAWIYQQRAEKLRKAK